MWLLLSDGPQYGYIECRRAVQKAFEIEVFESVEETDKMSDKWMHEVSSFHCHFGTSDWELKVLHPRAILDTIVSIQAERERETSGLPYANTVNEEPEPDLQGNIYSL